jgi:hypothetical protein
MLLYYVITIDCMRQYTNMLASRGSGKKRDFQRIDEYRSMTTWNQSISDLQHRERNWENEGYLSKIRNPKRGFCHQRNQNCCCRMRRHRDVSSILSKVVECAIHSKSISTEGRKLRIRAIRANHGIGHILFLPVCILIFLVTNYPIMIRSALSNSVTSVTRRQNGSIRQMSKVIKFGVEGRAAILKGVDTLADAVQVRESYPTKRILDRRILYHLLRENLSTNICFLVVLEIAFLTFSFFSFRFSFDSHRSHWDPRVVMPLSLNHTEPPKSQRMVSL